MIQELIDIKETDTLDELRARLAHVLGWNEPVPAAALLRAVEEPSYAAALLTSRNAPEFLAILLNDRRNARYVPAPQPAAADGNIALLGKAATAMLRWGKAGFSVAEPDVIARRESACLACEHLRDPDRLVQKLLPSSPVSGVAGRRTGNKICDLCGCQVAKKIRLPTEACPSPHTEHTGMTRWQEPLKEQVPPENGGVSGRADGGLQPGQH